MTDLSYTTTINDSGNQYYQHRLLIGTPVTGLVRIEWVGARYGQVVPCNWSMVTMQHYLASYMPYRYQVDDAQNMIVRECIEKEYEWCLLLEHDVVIPVDCFIRLNKYMNHRQIPVVSGLYYTRSRPSEPLVYRGRGNSYYGKWKFGERVWADGVPTGLLLIHASLLKKMWEESPEYMVGNQVTRRVFETPRHQWYDPQANESVTTSGTSDLYWCDRVMQGDYFRKSGWGKFADRHPKYPFLVDTRMFCRHIDMSGEQYP